MKEKVNGKFLIVNEKMPQKRKKVLKNVYIRYTDDWIIGQQFLFYSCCLSLIHQVFFLKVIGVDSESPTSNFQPPSSKILSPIMVASLVIERFLVKEGSFF